MRINMANRRKDLNLTQEEVAKRVGIARTTYTNIELGDKNPSLQVALKIKEVLKADDEIFLILSVPKSNTKENPA